MRRPECGTEYSGDAKFCEECGCALPQVRTCPNCGKELKPTAKFCKFCGFRFPMGGQDDAPSNVASEDKRVIAGDMDCHKEI